MNEFIAVFDDLPMPPSMNSCYATVGNRRLASVELKQFQKDMTWWGVANRQKLIDAMVKIKRLPATEMRIGLKFHFIFRHKDLFTIKGLPKKIDTSNRIKPAEDAFCELIGIDDKYVFNLTAEKSGTAAQKSLSIGLYLC